MSAARAVNKAGADLVWIGGHTLEPAGISGVNSSPVMVDRVLYFGGLDGVIYALDV